jgi:hypothetical protein
MLAKLLINLKIIKIIIIKKKKKGVAGHSIIGQPPPWPILGGRSTPIGLGGDTATLKRSKKKKKGLGFGGGRTTPQTQTFFFCFNCLYDLIMHYSYDV